MSNLSFGNFPANLLDPYYFGFEEHFPSYDAELDRLSASEIRVRDPITGATISLLGSFVIDDGFIVDGTVTRMLWKTGSGALLLDWTGLSVPIWDALYLDPISLLAGNDTITGGTAEDILLGFEGNDLVRGGGGDDLLLGLEGRDTLEGGPGTDLMSSSDEQDWSANLFVVSSATLARDGDTVVIEALSNLLGDLPYTGEVAFFRADLETLAVERVFGPFDGSDLFSDLSVSDDGQWLTVLGLVRLAGAAGSNYPQVLLIDLDSGTATVESRTPDGSFAQYMPEAPVLSGDGGSLAFVYLDGDLIPDDTNGLRDVFYKRIGSDTIERASEAEDGTEADGPSAQPVFSRDGSLLAFVSSASNLTPESDGTPAAYLRDLDSGELTWVAHVSQPRSFAFDIGVGPIALSANGRYLAFVSDRPDLVADDFNGVADVFVRDLLLGTTVRASVDFDGAEGYEYSDQPAISGDGRFVAFVTRSTWYGTGYDGNFSDDVYVKDLATDMLYRVPVPGHDNVGMASVSRPQLTFDGDTLVFRYASDGTVLGQFDFSGVDLMRGGTGDDIYLLLREDTVVEAVGAGYDVVGAALPRYELPANVEGLGHPFPGNFEGIGNASDNRFLGGPGDDSWYGGGGLDILSWPVPAAEVEVAQDGSDWLLSHPLEGTDRLVDVERVEFEDGGLAFDVGPQQHAGQAFALWYAAVDLMPVPEEITPWILAFDAGSSAVQVAQQMLDFFAPIVGGITDELLVSTLWQNIVGEPPSQETLDFYLGLLQGGATTQAALYADAAAHPFNHANFAPLVEGGIAYLPPPFEWDGVLDTPLGSLPIG